jgi:hypothetical protein
MMYGRRVALPVRLIVRNWPVVWRDISSRSGPGPDLEVVNRVGKPNRLVLDAWELRDEFLRARKDEQLLSFLNKTGQFLVGPEYRKKKVYWEFQRLISDMLRLPPLRWKEITKQYREYVAEWANPETRNGLVADLKFAVEDGLPIAQIFVVGTLRGIVASVHIDHLKRVPFGICQRSDCATPFPIMSQHQRKWCKPECGRVENQRRTRAQKPSKRSGRPMPR